nr:hypothetical protein [uncultured Treponema sp.]
MQSKKTLNLLFILILMIPFSSCKNAATGEENIPYERTIPLTLEAIEDGKITISNTSRTVVWYTLDNDETRSYAQSSGSVYIYVYAGEKVSFFANISETWGGQSNTDYININCSADCYVYGNIMSLFCENFKSAKSLENSAYTFTSLFEGNKHIKNHSQKKLCLPATRLEERCYYRMFYGCSSLTSAPELPATNLTEKFECYREMFSGCTSLTTAPILPAKKLCISCYRGMFSGCTSLTTAPELPATTLEGYCYERMFWECSSLINSPTLPATILAYGCYLNMFFRCKSLITAPILPATKLEERCYEGMFYDCPALRNAPDLLATQLKKDCYKEMFCDCKLINYLKCLGLHPSEEENVYRILSGCSSTGTLVKDKRVTWPDGSLPSGWTIVDEQ